MGHINGPYSLSACMYVAQTNDVCTQIDERHILLLEALLDRYTRTYRLKYRLKSF